MSDLDAILGTHADRGLGGILYEVYCAAYCAGAGIDDDTPHSAYMRQIIYLLEDRRRAESPPVLSDELPGWLLSLAQQADTVEPPTVEGWPV